VPARDRAVVDRARRDAPRLAAALAHVGGQGCYLYCLDPVDPAAVAHARFLNPTVGSWEDPATGSAAGPLVSRLVAQIRGLGRVAAPRGRRAAPSSGARLGGWHAGGILSCAAADDVLQADAA
jgi:trans-2,3-dihydro-3-hydroxyanthranilate isomerase